jgi:hypothetical protein
MTSVERFVIQDGANRAGLTLSSYVLSRVLNATPARQVRRPPIERQEMARLLAEVGRVGSAINQIARLGIAGRSNSGLDALAQASQDLTAIRSALLRGLGYDH